MISVFERFPFDEGVGPADIIERVNDKKAAGLSLEQVTNLLRRVSDRRASIDARCKGQPKPLMFELERRQIQIRNPPVSS